MQRLAYLILLLFIKPLPLKAALDTYSRIDEIDGWLIERKIDTSTKQILCRASVKDSYTWFGGRIRITSAGDLVVPGEFANNFEMINPSTLKKVREAIRLCNSSYIYSGLEINE